MKAENRKWCIVTDDDQILEKDLTHDEAQTRLTYYLQRGEDCWIGETGAYE